MHPSKIEFLTSERISRIAHEAKSERFRRGNGATEQGKVGRLLAGLLQPSLQGLTTRKPQEQCC
jgi:hypothetical protein